MQQSELPFREINAKIGYKRRAPHSHYCLRSWSQISDISENESPTSPKRRARHHGNRRQQTPSGSVNLDGVVPMAPRTVLVCSNSSAKMLQAWKGVASALSTVSRAAARAVASSAAGEGSAAEMDSRPVKDVVVGAGVAGGWVLSC